MTVNRVTSKNLSDYQAEITAIEALAVYPLGQDSFRLDHGTDYLAFFRRLGAVYYYALMKQGRVAAVAAGIIRTLPGTNTSRPLKSWYLCDLKVHPDFRGQHLPLRLLARVFLLNYLRCPRGYAISMDPGDGSPNRVVKLLNRFRWAKLELVAKLGIYSLSLEEVKRLRPLIETHRGPISFLSLKGKKDLILASTGKPLPLLHIQHAPCGERGVDQPATGHTHMLSIPASDPLAHALAAEGVFPSATASVIAHRMHALDWRFVMTSDI